MPVRIQPASLLRRSTLSLPFRQIVFVEIPALDEVAIFVGDRDDFAGLRIEIRGPFVVGKIHGVDDVRERDYYGHGESKQLFDVPA